MSWYGKLACGSLGMFLGGPLGAIVGAALGHHFIDKKRSSPGDGFNNNDQRGQLSEAESLQAAYFACVFSILGKIAKADGAVTPDELAVVEKIIQGLNVAEEEKKFARRIFNEAKASPYSLDDFALQFYGAHHDRPTILYSFVDIIFQVAAADGVLHPAEEASIRRIKDIFHLQDQQFDSIQARYFKGADKHYRILHCTPESTDEEIKKNYKSLAKEFHPDTIISKGLPDEFIQFATSRFQEIQEAYEQIKQKRGF